MNEKILVIVGPTASGKTSLSIELAKKYNGEIISADSRQVYRGLDLGTGKVTKEEMRGIPHHCIDIADPNDIYTVADFVRDGREAIAAITARGNTPIIACGTFFYIDALLGRVSTPAVSPNPALRASLAARTTDDLFAELQRRDPERAKDIDRHNPRRLIRALEIVHAQGHVPKNESRELYRSTTFGIQLSKETLYTNIKKRLGARLDAGMVAEVQNLVATGVSFERLDDLGLEYRYIAQHLQGTLSYDEMVATLETKIRQFAKRQMTWLKRNPSIQWIAPGEMIDITSFISKNNS